MLKELKGYIEKGIKEVKIAFNNTDSFIPEKCVICDKYIYGQYYLDAWGGRAHPNHDIKLCSTCGRIIDDKAISISDNRNICENCQKSLVKTKKDIDWVEQKVLQVYKMLGGVDIQKLNTLTIVSSKELMKLQGGSFITPNQHGLTITKSMGNTKQHDIYILDYLPKVLFAGVLAHEFLHVWQNENNYTPTQNICEGFCNLGAFMIYNNIGNDYAKYYINQLQNDKDPIYGDGYRKVKKTFDNKSWEYVVNKIKTYK